VFGHARKRKSWECRGGDPAANGIFAFFLFFLAVSAKFNFWNVKFEKDESGGLP
jgi:hypothetical protein